jgi:diaminopimelate decarboxylase
MLRKNRPEQQLKEGSSAVHEAIFALKKQQQRPLCAYIYNLAALREHVRHVMASLPKSCRLFYAMKANSESRILETLAPLVHGFEVASLGEIAQARAIDQQIALIFGGPGKTDEELLGALEQNVLWIHVESLHELRRLAYIQSTLQAAERQTVMPILLRVNLRSPLPGATLHMAGRPTQFGIDEVDVPQAIQLCQQFEHVRLQGLHFHSLSNNLDAQQHIRLIRTYCQQAQRWRDTYGLTLTRLNVGGGIGINFADTARQFDWLTFTMQLEHLCREEIPEEWELFFECGRYLTAACGTYAVEVLDIKQNHGKHFLIVAGGSHHFRLPVSWQHNHPFHILPVDEWRYPFPRTELIDCEVTITGQLCTPKDVLARDVFVPRIRIGDVLLFQYAGAYGWSISHHDFLSHPHPQFVYLE